MSKRQKRAVSRRAFINQSAAAGLGAAALAGAATEAGAQPRRQWDLEADVVVIGSGATGLPAAIRARDKGASVIVVEANYDVGGHGILSGGSLPLGGGTSWQKQHGIEDSPDQVFKDLTDWSVVLPHGIADYRYNDREVQRAFADNCAATFEFLIANGIVVRPPAFDSGSVGISALRMCAPVLEGVNVPGPMSPGGGRGAANIRPLEASARKKGVRFLLNYHMDRLFRESPTAGRVLGLEASYRPRFLPGSTTRLESYRSEGNIALTRPTVSVRARKAVIIASGGSSSNANFRRIFDPRLTEEHQTGGEPYSFQDASGELAAMAIGASLWATANAFERRRVIMKRNVVGSQYTYTQWGPKSPLFPFSRASGINLGIAGWEHVISVNQVGKRFCDETHGELPDGTGYNSIDGYVHGSFRNTRAKPHANADGVKQERPLYVHAALALNEGSQAPDYAAGPVWVIFDADAVARRKWNVEPPFVDKEHGYFFAADTLEELARGLTRNTYQKVPMPPANLVATVARYNSFVDLGKDEDFEKPGPKHKIQTPPFYAAWGTPICHDTVTGLRINGKCQVIDLHGHVIPGLYCGGESAGGSNQHGWGRCSCQGYISGGNAADEVAPGR
ncbi:MAG: FAD-binding protein [Vicinamibacterales bacterium]